MLRRTLILSLSMMLLVAAQAAAERFQITPFGGYRFGGDVDDFAVRGSFDLEETEILGLAFDLGINENLFVELVFTRQETRLEERAFFFASRPLFDLDIDYYHAGVLYRWDLDRVRPFVVGTVGVTEFDPQPPNLDSESRPSVAFGGGVQLFFGAHFGLRFEGRAYTTFVDDSDRFTCDGAGCYGYGDGTYLWQFEGNIGLIFAF